MNNKTRLVVASGMSVAIYALFFLVSLSIGGILESNLFFLLPIPLIIFTYKYSFKYAIIPYFSIAIIGYLINPISTLIYILTANILGIIYGEMLRKQVQEKIRLLVCIIATFIVDLMSMVIFASLLNYSIQAEIKELLIFFLKLLKLNELVSDKLVFTCIPIFLSYMAFIDGYLVHLFTQIIMGRLKLIEYNRFSIYDYKPPRWMSFVYFILLGTHLASAYFFYMADSILSIVGGILLILFWVIVLPLFIYGYFKLITNFRNRKQQIIFVIVMLISIIFCPILFLLIISFIGAIKLLK